jgi:hypothetical protein
MPAFLTISTQADLIAALKNASQGDVIALTAGNYGKLTLKGQAGFDMGFAGGVSIVSADPDDMAVFTGLDLRGAANLTFAGVTFDYSFAAGDRAWTRPFNIQDSHNITISNSVFDGDVATGISVAEDGFANGIALGIRDSSGIAIEENRFTNFTRGVVTTDSQDIQINGNELSEMRSDGLNFAGVQRVQIADNYIHDFRSSVAANDHADFIQFWTRGTTTASTDISITGNRLDIGNGSLTQSIFMRNDQVDRGLAGFEMFYGNVTITDNVIVNAQTHGITVGETDGLIIANNTVTHADGANQDGADASVEIPRITVSDAAVNVQVTQNITGGLSIPSGQAGWTVADNVIVQDQDPDAPNYYSDVFLASSLNDAGGNHAYQAIPGGILAQVGAGASATYAGFTGESGTMLSAQFQVSSDASNAAARVFDAGTSTSGDGITYHWTFGDGGTAVGATVSHTYQSGGTFDVTLTVQDASGGSTLAASTVGVAGPQVLSMQENGQFVVYDMGDKTVLDGMGQGDAGGLYLGAAGTSVTVDRGHVADILNTDSFEIALSFHAHHAGAAGEVFRLHSSFLTQIDAAGEMRLYAWTKDGDAIKLTTSGAGLNDGANHDVAIRLLDGEISLIADGVAVSAAMTGELADLGRHDLYFGNPWGKSNFAGSVTAFDVTVNAEDYIVPNIIGGTLGAADSFDFIAEAGEAAPDMFIDTAIVVADMVTEADITTWDDANPVFEALGLPVDEFGF